MAFFETICSRSCSSSIGISVCTANTTASAFAIGRKCDPAQVTSPSPYTIGCIPYTLIPMPYLLKTEPDKYSYDDLLRDGETTWDGISNPQALLNLRSMKKGEKLVIYHSNVGKAAIGTAKVLSVDATNPKKPIVRIAPVKRLKREKTLAEMRDASVFKDSILFRQFRLSVVPLTQDQYDWLTQP